MASRLQQEIKQSKPFANLETEAYLNLLRTEAVLRTEHQALLKPHDLSEPTYNVLRILRGAGPDGLPSQDIGERLITMVPDVTRLVDCLERKGWAERARTAEDRRVVLVKITAKGLDLLKQLEKPLNDQLLKRLGNMTKKELAELIRLLEKVREGRE